jgi:long-chain acyl-CoA synthetase
MNPTTIAASFERLAELHPRKTALVYLGTRYTYAQIRRWADSFATSLSRMGVLPGDRVMIYLPN